MIIISKLTQPLEGRFSALLSAASNALIMALVLFLVAICLNPKEQGYFFTFLSFAGLAQLFDFGLAYASMQTASHYQVHKNTLRDLKHQVTRVSVFSCIVALPLVEIVGFFTLTRGGLDSSSDNSSWLIPWLFYIPVILAGLPIAALLAIHEGSGAIGAVWRLRLNQEWIAGGILLVGLLSGMGLWSLVFSAGIRPIIGWLWLILARSGHHTPLISSPQSQLPLVWRLDIWPFQWKIGLSFLCGFLIFKAIIPVVLFERGEVVAGQIGLAISVMNAIIAFSTAWPTSQAARYGSLLASKAYTMLKVEFQHALLWSTLLCAGTIICACAFLQTLKQFMPFITNRLPSFYVITLILGAAIFHHTVICFAAPLRAERREPLLLSSVIGSIVTIIAIWLAARYAGPLEIAIVNLICAAVGLPIAIYIFRRRLNSWISSG